MRLLEWDLDGGQSQWLGKNEGGPVAQQPRETDQMGEARSDWCIALIAQRLWRMDVFEDNLDACAGLAEDKQRYLIAKQQAEHTARHRSVRQTVCRFGTRLICLVWLPEPTVHVRMKRVCGTR